MKSKALRSALLGFGYLATAVSAHAQYPERPIEMIVAYSAGGGTDVAARTLESFIEKYLGGDITVVNKPGAGGEIGFTALATAEPNGYTIGFINTPNALSIPIERETRYSLESFAPVANIVTDPGGISVAPDSRFQNLQDLVEYAKENPGELTYGTTGIGSDDHLAMLTLERQTGAKFQHVPFEGAAKVRAALLGGHIDLGVINVSEVVSEAREGQLRILGQMAEERWEEAQDVPTFREQGYDIVAGSNRGIAAPAGTDPEVIQKLASAIEQTINDPEFRQKAQEQALPLDYVGPEAYGELLRSESDRLRELWENSPWVQK